jgi:hypothetical protein
MAVSSAATYHRPAARWRVAVLCCILLAGWVWVASDALAEESEDSGVFIVVAHPKVAVKAADSDLLTDLFLKRTTRWSDGEHVRPVDLKPTSSVRKRFSESVLKRSVSAVRSYWQQRIFSGRALPPPELESEQAVIRYVSKHPGGIGYVGRDAETTGVKVLTVR